MMEPIEIIIPPSDKGFDAIGFLRRAHDVYLRQRIGLVALAEFREQVALEEAEGEGNA